MIVLVIEDNLPSLAWKYGIVVKTYPGADQLVRVVDIKTTSGIFKRAISKLAPLPIQDNYDLQQDEVSSNETTTNLHCSKGFNTAQFSNAPHGTSTL